MEIEEKIGRDAIAPYVDDVWEICQRAYQPIGGFLSIADKSDVLKRVNRLKLVNSVDAKGNSKIGAVALYRRQNEGFKGIAYAGNKGVVENYRECIQAIILDDVKRYAEWYWTEASGAVAHYFEKNGGIPIPNIYVPYLLEKEIPEDAMSDDGFTYTTPVGPMGNQTSVEKRLYGFINKATFDRLIAIYNSMENFVSNVNRLKNREITPADLPSLPGQPKLESIETMQPDEIRSYIMYIYNMDDTCTQNRCWVVPKSWIDMLDFSMKKLHEAYSRLHSQGIEDALFIGQDLRARVTPVTYGQFHITSSGVINSGCKQNL